jgi:choline dehydrogenase-like flavoprotein
MDRPNLTVLTHALVTRVTFEDRRASGVEMSYDGKTQRVGAGLEVVLSLGAIQTPKVLMQSGIGDQAELRRLGIPVVQHLPGVGQNFQDHVAFDCVWEYREALPPRNTMCEATFFWKGDAGLDSPDVQACQAEVPKSSAENAARFTLPAAGWTLFGGVLRPNSRGIGAESLGRPMPTSCVTVDRDLATSGIWMKSFPPSMANGITSGGRWIRTEISWTSWCNGVVTRRPPRNSSASC